jgi:signal transduction histidine kinase
VRELAMNVVKHAKAQHITVTMEARAEELLLETIDDGKGFSPAALLQRDFSRGGYGLFSIHERMTYIRGDMTVDSTPGKGTRILLRVPLEERQESNQP